MKDTYFIKDKYWEENINKQLETDFWIDDYKTYFNKGTCLDLGCGIGQFSKKLMEYGLDVTSLDISDIALNEVKKFNNKVIKADIRDRLPFNEETFEIVFANLSIHYFNDNDTRRLIAEIKRILKTNGLFIGSVNSIEGYKIKSAAKEIEKHYWFNEEKYFRLFDKEDLRYYLNGFEIELIEKRETIRFNSKKNYLIFIVRKKYE